MLFVRVAIWVVLFYMMGAGIYMLKAENRVRGLSPYLETWAIYLIAYLCVCMVLGTLYVIKKRPKGDRPKGDGGN